MPAGEQSVSTSPSSTVAGTDSHSPTDAEIRRELSQLKHLAAGADSRWAPSAACCPTAAASRPRDAPPIVRDVIRAGNVIAKTPYLWGGGHGSWSASGYDCSGSVSFALAGAGLLDSPLTSGAARPVGAPGRGRWITVYANGGHVFMEVAGLRFDTGGISGSGTRWQATGRSTSGFVARHPEGLYAPPRGGPSSSPTPRRRAPPRARSRGGEVRAAGQRLRGIVVAFPPGHIMFTILYMTWRGVTYGHRHECPAAGGVEA